MSLSPFGEMVLIWLPLALLAMAASYSVLWGLFYNITGRDPWAH